MFWLVFMVCRCRLMLVCFGVGCSMLLGFRFMMCSVVVVGVIGV